MSNGYAAARKIRPLLLLGFPGQVCEPWVLDSCATVAVGCTRFDALESMPADPPETVIPRSLQPGQGSGRLEYSSVGSYELLERLGEGGMGRLYLGRHVTLGDLAAVKVLKYHLVFHESSQRRFWHEAQTLAAIDHPGIVEMYEFGETKEGVPYLAMEYVRGRLLEEIVASGRRTPMREVLAIARQIADALEAVHKKGIAHRDLKPSNIMLVDAADDEVRVKVLDFGIAKTLALDEDETKITRTGIIVGTPRYMSPEQCTGHGHIDHRADIYCLGIILYELLAGQCPFEGGDVVTRHQFETPVAPSRYRSNISDRLEAAILRCLAKNPADRYQTMNELAAFLAEESARVRANPLYNDEALDPTHDDTDFAERSDIAVVTSGDGAFPHREGPTPAAGAGCAHAALSGISHGSAGADDGPDVSGRRHECAHRIRV